MTKFLLFALATLAATPAMAQSPEKRFGGYNSLQALDAATARKFDPSLTSTREYGTLAPTGNNTIHSSTGKKTGSGVYSTGSTVRHTTTQGRSSVPITSTPTSGNASFVTNR